MNVLEGFKSLIERKDREIEELKKDKETILVALLNQGRENTELQKKFKELNKSLESENLSNNQE